MCDAKRFGAGKHLGYEWRAAVLQTDLSFKLSGDEITWSQWSGMQSVCVHVQRTFSRSTLTHGSEPDYSFVFQEEGLWHISMFVPVIIGRTRAETEVGKNKRTLLWCYSLLNPNRNAWSYGKFGNVTRPFIVQANLPLVKMITRSEILT